MSIATLDLNDATLALWRGGEPVRVSPGYALLSDGDYAFGEPARAQARLHPRQVNHRFWSQLDTQPIKPEFGPARHTADLVHAHLLELHREGGEPAEVLLAAPASLSHEQLSLLLGIIEHSPFRAAGLVDRAVAALAARAAAEWNWHAELQLHQALLTGVRRQGDMLLRERVVPIPGAGLLGFQEAISRAVADTFIRQTRFDPRRSAATEQELYDRLPGLLEALSRAPEHNLELRGHHARVERELLARSCEDHFRRIRAAMNEAPGELVAGPTLRHLPGMIEALTPGALEQPLDEAAVHEGAVRHVDTIAGGDGVHFITRLPAGEKLDAQQAPAAPSQTPGAAETPDPLRGRILLYGDGPVLEPGPGATLRVNGETVSGSRDLSAGDRIELGGGEVWRIVRDDG